MVDLIREQPLELKEVAARFKVTMKTVYAWIDGVNGRRLETAKVGGKRYTTAEAIQRFSLEDDTRLGNTPSQSAQRALRSDTEARARNHGIR